MTDVSRETLVRQSIDNLHDDITRSVVEDKRKVLEVIDPSPGIWGGDPVEGLVTIVYECGCNFAGAEHPNAAPGKHAHHALYGPTDERDRQPGEAVDHYSLYAD